MGRLVKEQVFFVVTLLLLSFLLWRVLGSPYERARVSSGKRMDDAELVAPEVATAPDGKLDTEGWLRGGRNTFEEPREWTELPPLDLPRPPLRAPAGVPPSPRPRLGSEFLGRLRLHAEVTPHEFESGADVVEVADDGEAAEGTEEADDFRTPEERWRQTFDWLEVKGSDKPLYGIIGNEDKWTLDARPDEPIEFRLVDPETSRVKASATIAREQVREQGLHLADTTANRIERMILSIPERTWAPTTAPRLLDMISKVMTMEDDQGTHFRRAEEELRKYQQLAPDEPRVYELLADVSAGRLDFRGERMVLDQAADAGVRSAGLELREARWFERYGASEHALATLTSALAEFRDDPALRAERGELYRRAGRSAESLNDLRAAVEQADGPSARAEGRMRLVAALLAEGQLDEAEREGRRLASAAESTDGRAWLTLGAVQFAAGDLDAASTSWSRAAESDDPSTRARASLGNGLTATRQRRFDDAASSFTLAERLDPTLGADVSAARAFLQEITGHDDGALSAALDALERDPGDAYVQYQTGRLHRRAGDLDSAMTHLRESLRLGAGFPDLYAELGYVSLMRGEAGDAARYHRESLTREARDEARVHLGHAHLVDGDELAARRVLEQAALSSERALGLAYCAYRRGESEVAKGRWQLVISELSDVPDDDRQYAEQSLAQVLDLESKQVWSDAIQWQAVGNGWEFDTRYGLSEVVRPGAFRMRGTQRVGTNEADWTYLKRDVERSTFHELAMRVSVSGNHQGRVGMGLVAWGNTFGQTPQPKLAVLVSVQEGTLSVLRRARVDDPDAVWQDVGQRSLAADEQIELTLRRVEKGGGKFQCYADGAPLGDPIEMNSWRGKQPQTISALFFASASSGQRVDAALHRATLVRYKEP